jgi:WD40 repeat protein
VLRGHEPGVFGTFVVEWSRDGTRLLSTASDGMRLWDVRTGRQVLPLLPEGGGPGLSGARSPDDRELLTESALGARVWSAATGKYERIVETGAPVDDLVFSRDGARLAIVTIDEHWTTSIRDWPSGVEVLGLREGGRKVAFSPDGKFLAGVRAEPTPFVHVWTLDPERLLQIARDRVRRSLTEDECHRYLHRSCATQQ